MFSMENTKEFCWEDERELHICGNMFVNNMLDIGKFSS